eukprot:352794-Chlamydomonas_euryale.AAC.2
MTTPLPPPTFNHPPPDTSLPTESPHFPRSHAHTCVIAARCRLPSGFLTILMGLISTPERVDAPLRNSGSTSLRSISNSSSCWSCASASTPCPLSSSYVGYLGVWGGCEGYGCAVWMGWLRLLLVLHLGKRAAPALLVVRGVPGWGVGVVGCGCGVKSVGVQGCGGCGLWVWGEKRGC